MKKKFIIITTIPLSLGFFKGQIQLLKRTFDVTVISSPGKRLDVICKQEQVEGYAVPMKREISVLQDIVSLYKLIRLFIKIKPGIIHGSTPKAGLLSMLAGWFNRVPTRIYYVHGLRYQGVKGFKKHLLMFMEKLSCFFSTHVYAVSFGVKNILEKEGITKKEIQIIGNGSANGIDLDYYSVHNPEIVNLNESYNLTSENFVFGFVGRLVKDKGIHELVGAFLKVNEINKNTRLLIVGDFEKEDPIDSKIIEEIKTNSAIIFVGFQSDIRSFLKMMNVFVFPSYREGFGVSLMEAAAMGVPAISSDIIGCNEIIRNKYNGLLIPSKSEDHLFSAMRKLSLDRKLLEEMSKVSRTYVKDKYEQKKLWESTIKSYIEIV